MVLKKIKKIKEVMSYVGKKVHKKKPVVKKPVTKKSTNPYSLADWKQGIKHKGKGYSRGGRIKKGITIIVDPKGRAKIKESVKQAKERGEKELEDFIKNLNPKKFQSGGLLKILKKIEGRYGKVDDIRKIHKKGHLKAKKLLKKIRATDEYKSYAGYKDRKLQTERNARSYKREKLLKEGKPIPKELQATKPDIMWKERGKKIFNKGGLVKPKSVRIAKRGWGKVIK